MRTDARSGRAPVTLNGRTTPPMDQKLLEVLTALRKGNFAPR